MRDAVTIERVSKLHPKVRAEVAKLIDEAEAKFPKNMAVRVVQGLRTIAEQNALYAQGRTKPGQIVTKAPGGKSFHNYGLAIDFAVLYDKDGNGSYDTLSWDVVADMDRDGQKDWMEVVAVFEKAGWVWGGRFKSIPDAPHFEKSFGYTVSQLLALYNAKKVDANGYVII